MPATQHNRHIRNLEALRSIATLLIFMHHCRLQNPILQSFGDYATTLFFMLSGFVLTQAWGKRIGTNKLRIKDILLFLKGRLIRLYPIYLITLPLYLFIARHYLHPLTVSADVLLLQSWIPSSSYHFSYNAVAWFLSTLMFCNILFLPLLHLMLRKRAIFNIACVIIAAAYIIILCITSNEKANYWLYIFPPAQIPAFMLGMIANRYVNKSTKTPQKHDIAIIVVTILTITHMVVYRYMPSVITSSIYWWVITFDTIIILTKAEHSDCKLNHLLKHPVLQHFGQHSYTFFLLHIAALHYGATIVLKSGILINNTLTTEWCIIIISFTICTAATMITDRMEEYTIRTLKRIRTSN